MVTIVSLQALGYFHKRGVERNSYGAQKFLKGHLMLGILANYLFRRVPHFLD
jgi:hypothetical protein